MGEAQLEQMIHSLRGHEIIRQGVAATSHFVGPISDILFDPDDRGRVCVSPALMAAWGWQRLRRAMGYCFRGAPSKKSIPRAIE